MYLILILVGFKYMVLQENNCVNGFDWEGVWAT
jgi:hypothetical protein